ncbi:hypothetical protein CB0940_02810 [Lecanosticta acicola]|uniref:CENP-V/GFA domain-containing protein n=1 Tax=Lecanosticta acicola TaxID=111012 RepID=A0AAI8YS66_9PEZI|nr:hypothetical protein CB0940_02810 [Lecanosticta acicola]
MADPEKVPVAPAVQFKGSCACERITYHCTDTPKADETGICHCVTCRKLSGGPYQAFTGVSAKSVTLFDQKEQLRYAGFPKDDIGGIMYLRFSQIGERSFCVSCYSPLAMRYKHRPDVVDLTLSSIDEDSIVGEDGKRSLRVSFHIFTSQKVSWIDIEKDGVPEGRRHERFSKTFEEKLSAWESKQQ